MSAKKILSAMFVFLIVGSFVAVPSYIEVNATTASPVVVVSSSGQNDTTISAVELTPWHNFKESVANYFDDLYQSVEDFGNYIKDMINDTYGSVNNFLTDIVNYFQDNSQ